MQMKKKSNKKTKFTAVLILLMGATVIMGLGGISQMPISTPPPAEENNAQNVNDTPSSSPATTARVMPCSSFLQPPPQQYRIYPHLAIIINGEKITIPANIGVTEDCKRIIHTSDDSGTIDVEPYNDTPLILGDFMNVWEKTFSPDQILDYKTDATHEITMTVDGELSMEYENLILKDNQQITIEYRPVVGSR